MGTMSGALGAMWVEIGAKIDGLERGLADASKAIGNAVSDAQGKFAGFEQIGAKLSSVGAGLTTGLTAPIAAIGLAATKFSTDFNAAMANVSTLIPGASARVNDLKSTVQDLAIATGKSTADLAGGLYQVVSAFGDSADTAKILETNARAATAGLATTTDAINLTSAVTKAYGDTSAESVAKVSDLAFVAVKLGQTTFPELAASIGKVTPTAQTMGVSMEELFGVMATFTGVTGSAAEVSTQLQGVLTGLLKPNEQMAQSLEKMGFESGKAAIEQLGLKGTLDALKSSVGGNDVALGSLFSQVEALRMVYPATGAQADTFASKIAAMGSAIGSTDEAFREQTAGINANGFAMQQVTQQAAVMAQKFGDALAPALSSMLSAAGPVLDWMQSAVQWFSELPRPVQMTAVAIAAVTAAIGPMLLVAGQLTQAFASINTALPLLQGGFSRVAGVASSALVPALIAIGAAVIGIQLSQLTEAVGEYWTAITYQNSVVETASGLLDSLAASLGSVFDEAQKTAPQFGTLGQNTREAGAATEFFQKVAEDLRNTIDKFKWSDFLTPLGPLRKAFYDAADAVKALRGLFPEMEKAGTNALGKLNEANKNWAQSQAEAAMRVHGAQKANAEAAEAQENLTREIEEATTQSRSHVEIVRELDKGSGLLAETYRQLADQHKKSTQELVKWRLEHETLQSRTPQYITATNELNDSIEAIGYSAKQSGVDVASFSQILQTELAAASQAVVGTEQAFKTLGITSSESLQQQAEQARVAYEKILGSATATVRDIDGAWIAYEDKRIKAAEAAGHEITKAERDELATRKGQLEGHLETSLGAYSAWGKQISSIITDAGKNLVGRLGDLFGSDTNDRLDKEAAELRASLDDRAKAWEEFQKQIAGDLGGIQAAYAADLAEQEADLRESLESRAKQYEAFQQEISRKLSEVGDKHKKAIEKERRDLLRGLDDRTEGYEDYVEDVQDRIAEITRSTGERTEDERKKVQKSLAERKKEYDRFVEDVNAKIAKLRDKNNGQITQEEKDLMLSLQRRSEDWAQYQIDAAQGLEDFTRKQKESADRQIAEQKEALDRRTRDFEQYKAEVQEKLVEVSEKHAEQQAKEEADLKASLDKKAQEYETYKVEAVAKFEDIKAASAAKLIEQEQDLKTKLESQRSAWEEYKNGAVAQLADLESQHEGIFDRIRSVATGVFTDIGTAIGRFVAETLVGKLFKELGTLVDDILPGVGKALGSILGGGASAAAGGAGAAAGTAGQAAGAAGSAGQGAAGAASAAAGGLTGIVGAIGSIGTMISGFISNFQMAKLETTMNAVEHNTRYSMMYLGERSDGGILGQLFRIAHTLEFGTLIQVSEQMRNQLVDWMSPIGESLADIAAQMHFAVSRLDQIGNDVMWGSAAERDTNTRLSEILAAVQAKTAVVNINISGAQSPASTASAVQMKLQGVML